MGRKNYASSEALYLKNVNLITQNPILKSTDIDVGDYMNGQRLSYSIELLLAIN